MSDFLGRLASRSLGLSRVAEPIIPATLLSAPGVRERQKVGEFRESAEQASERAEGAAGLPTIEKRGQGRTERPVLATPERGGRDAVASRVGPEPADRANAEVRAEIVVGDSAPRAVPERSAPKVLALDATFPVASAPDTPRERTARLPERTVAERAEAPVIRVTIGRIEVRAQFPSGKPERAPVAQSKPAALSLDDYLKQRREGRR